MKHAFLNWAVSLAVLSAAGTAFGQTPSASVAAPAGWDQWVKQTKNPADWISWGADLRLRNEYFDNALTLNEGVIRHEQDYFRLRERFWASLMPHTNLSINARLAAEQREWMKPSFVRQYGNRSGLEDRYAILDNANVKWNHLLDTPFSISAGRQDVQFGDPLNWWLVCDGTPYDGSWTLFLDSVRAAWEIEAIQTKLDLVYIYQNALPDEWVPTIGRSGDNIFAGTSRPYWLTEQNEQGVIVYASNKSVKNTQIDGYFIYKQDRHEDAILYPGTLTPLGDDAEIYTVGGKVTGSPWKGLKYSAEGAYQFGHKADPTVRAPLVENDSRPINAFGVNASLAYLFHDRFNNQISLAYEYLSGDDSKTTGRDEMFDVLWGRWPRWSELYIYSYPNETSGKFAQLNNIWRIGPTWSLNPVKKVTFSATYNALFAPESVPTRALRLPSDQLAQFSQAGNFRGHYLQSVVKYQINKNISTHLWGECIWQGDYYSQRDLLTFVRAEVMFAF